jgi:hypothetical protein
MVALQLLERAADGDAGDQEALLERVFARQSAADGIAVRENLVAQRLVYASIKRRP